MSDDHTNPPDAMTLRVKSLETLLVDRGLIDPEAVETFIQYYEKEVGPQNGAKVVARAWVDPEYRKRLMTDATAAIAELGYSGLQGEDMVVLENTPEVHNVVVCTLCSCYPWPVLGLPPTWYKSFAYRSRVVMEPRAVLEEFGLSMHDEVEVRVYDSNAELRYMVLPMRPEGSEDLTEDALAALVTRDSMIGTGLPTTPEVAA